MEFLLSDEDRALRERAVLFARETLSRFLVPPAFPFRAWTRGLRDELREAGFTGLRIPAEMGGMECTALQTALVLEEIGRVSPPLAFFLAVHNGFCVAQIRRHGTAEQSVRLLRGLATGENLGSWRPSDTGDGSGRAASVETRFDSGRWMLRGGPIFEIGIEGELAVVAAEIKDGGTTGSSKVFLARRIGTSGSIPAEILGDGAGEETMTKTAALGKIYTAACRLGRAEALLAGALDAEPEERSEAAEVLMEVEAARLRTYRACLLEDAGRAGRGEEAILADRVAEDAVRAATRIAARRADGPQFFAEAAHFIKTSLEGDPDDA
jgi:hypothetical protein